ncbi:MAG: DUF4834 family protein [Mariniphaga sp.]|nr:DUF4834 family protein [Mariniphaga sp.]MDD4226946.1 DUF4834 family protein [Mariniphaga sp.]MDD4425645.1 DUF4834 family protein [Mariniphaga sp.]
MNLFILLNPVGLFRTIIFIAVIYFIIRLVTRYIIPSLLENKIKEVQKKMQDQENQHKRNGKHEGEVTIEYDRKHNNISKREEGEYVDFEEVD